MSVEHKICSACKERKPRTDFHRRGDRAPGSVVPRCKACCAVSHRDYMESPAAKAADRAAHNAAYANNPDFREETKTRSSKRYWQDPLKSRNNKLKRKYGMTPEEFSRLAASQGGVCAICGGPPRHQKRDTFCVDHCHATGKVRGLLCSKCNVAIGMLRDSPQFAASAAYYLAKHTLNTAPKA